MSAHYHYIASKVDALSPVPNPACLDFGCWEGSLMGYLRENTKADVVGLDLEDMYQETAKNNVAKAGFKFGKDIHTYDGKRSGFKDDQFDIVIANMVFEHVQNPEEVLSEIRRILKPSGVFLALFPTSESIWEDHVKLYFVHKMDKFKSLQYHYIKLMHRLGFVNATAKARGGDEYAHEIQGYLDAHCYYRSSGTINTLWDKAFGAKPTTDEAEYIRSRIESHPKLKKFSKLAKLPVMKHALKAVCIMLATRVFILENPAELNNELRAA